MGSLIDAGARANRSVVDTYGMAFRAAFFSVALVFVLSVVFYSRSKQQ